MSARQMVGAFSLLWATIYVTGCSAAMYRSLYGDNTWTDIRPHLKLVTLAVDKGRGTVSSWSADTGAPIWRIKRAGVRPESASRLIVVQDHVLILDDGLTALNLSDGSLVAQVQQQPGLEVIDTAKQGVIWRVPGRMWGLAAFAGTKSWFVKSDNPVVAVFAGDNRNIFAAKSGTFTKYEAVNGAILWQVAITSEVSSLWAVNDIVVMITNDRQLVALSAMDGQQLWKTSLPTAQRYIQSPDRVLLVGDALVVVNEHWVGG